MGQRGAGRSGSRKTPVVGGDLDAVAVVALVGDPAVQDVLVSAVRHLVPPPVNNHLRVLHAGADFSRAVLDTQPLVALVDPALCSEPEALMALRRRAPRVTLVAVVTPTPEGAQRAVALVRAGLDSVWTMGSDAVELGEVIGTAVSRRVTHEVLDHLGGRIPPAMRSFLEQLWWRCMRPVSPREAAKLYFRDPSTLRRHLNGAGLPAAGHLIVWGRLFHAARLLEAGMRTVSNVAVVLGFPSSNALAIQLKRYTNLTPTEVRRRGLRHLAREFIRRHDQGSWELDDRKAG